MKLVWDINIQSDNIIEARKTDVVFVDKVDKNCLIVDVTKPLDVRVHEKEQKKV